MENLSKEELELKFQEQRDIYVKAYDAMIDIEQKLKILNLSKRPVLTEFNSYYKCINHLESKTYYMYILRYNEDRVDCLWFCKTENIAEGNIQKLGLEQGINNYYNLPSNSTLITKEEFDSIYLKTKEMISTFDINTLIEIWKIN